MERRDKERRLGSEGGKVSVWKGLSEVLLEEVQQRNFVMFSRLWTPDAVSLVGINLGKQKTCLITMGSAEESSLKSV